MAIVGRTQPAGLLLLTAVFVGAIDQTVVASLLPAIVREFSLPLDRLDTAAWTVTLYLGCYAAVLPLAGRIVDRGRARTLYKLALSLFMLGSIGCAVAGSLGPLIAGRATQALGAGLLIPLALASAARRPGGDERLAAMGVVIGVAEAGAMLGPLYGAGVLAVADWRWAFWLNTPITVLLLLRSRRAAIREWSLSPDAGRTISLAHAISVVAIGLLVMGLSREAGRLAWWIPWTSGLGAALLLVIGARAGSGGLGDLPRTVRVRAALTAHFLLGVALITPLVLVPVWASVLLDRSANEAAGILLRLTLAIPPMAVLGAIVAPHIGRATVAGSGFAVSAAGLFMMARWSANTDEAGMLPALALTGCGLGFLLGPTTEALLDRSTTAKMASVLGWATAARVVGMSVGLAVMTSWGLDRLAERLAALPFPFPRPSESAVTFAGRVQEYRRAAIEAGVEIFGVLFFAGGVAAALGVCAAVWAIRSPGTASDSLVTQIHVRQGGGTTT